MAIKILGISTLYLGWFSGTPSIRDSWPRKVVVAMLISAIIIDCSHHWISSSSSSLDVESTFSYLFVFIVVYKLLGFVFSSIALRFNHKVLVT
jgi:hypothetical protein